MQFQFTETGSSRLRAQKANMATIRVRNIILFDIKFYKAQKIYFHIKTVKLKISNSYWFKLNIGDSKKKAHVRLFAWRAVRKRCIK